MRSLVKTTTVVAALGVCLLSGLPGEAQDATPSPQSPELKPLSDQQRIQGTWRYTTAKIEGNEIDKQKLEMVTFTFSGNTLAVFGLNKTPQTEFSLDATKKPKHIDLKHQADSDGYVVDKGIYRFEDDTLMICTGGFGASRPTEKAKPCRKHKLVR